MSIEQGLFEFLRDSVSVGAVVGDRIRQTVAAQGVTKPYVVFQRISTVPDYVMGGDRIDEARFQVDAWGDTAESAAAAGDAMRAALDFLSGALGSSTVELIRIADQRVDYEEATRLYRDSTDYLIRYQ